MSEPTPIRRAKPRRYSQRTKMTTVIAAEMTTVGAAAESAGIPETTVRYWMDAPEFVLLRTKTREDMAEESASLAHKVLGAINRRLSDFEPRDLTILFGVLVDKSQLLSGQATARNETISGGMDDHERAKLREVLTRVTSEVKA